MRVAPAIELIPAVRMELEKLSPRRTPPNHSVQRHVVMRDIRDCVFYRLRAESLKRSGPHSRWRDGDHVGHMAGLTLQVVTRGRILAESSCWARNSGFRSA